MLINILYEYLVTVLTFFTKNTVKNLSLFLYLLLKNIYLQ